MFQILDFISLLFDEKDVYLCLGNFELYKSSFWLRNSLTYAETRGLKEGLKHQELTLHLV